MSAEAVKARRRAAELLRDVRSDGVRGHLAVFGEARSRAVDLATHFATKRDPDPEAVDVAWAAVRLLSDRIWYVSPSGHPSRAGVA